jgi:hypothetical protein
MSQRKLLPSQGASFPVTPAELQEQSRRCVEIWQEAAEQAAKSAHAEVCLWTLLGEIARTFKENRGTSCEQALAYVARIFEAAYSEADSHPRGEPRPHLH